MSQPRQSSVCEKCQGSGKISYRTLGDVEPRPFTEGTTIQNMGGWSTRACSCVRDLPATNGTATWWDLETVYSEVVQVPIGCECVDVKAEVEVPRGEDGRRYHRTIDNAYYPPLVSVEGPESFTLHGSDARLLGEALIAAADACDKADAHTESIS